MKDLEELLQHFRNWNSLWDKYQDGKLENNIKPTSKETFLKELNKRYEIIKRNNE